MQLEMINDAEAAEARTNLLNQSFAFMWVQLCEDSAVLVRQLALSVTSSSGYRSFAEVCMHACVRLLQLY